VFDELAAINLTVAIAAYNLIRDFAKGQAGNLELRTLRWLYSLLTPALAPATLTALQIAIAANNIPLSV
jgi:hypothetical protein